MSTKKDQDDDKVQLKREIGFLHGVGVIMGCVIGTGIFISPTAVLRYSKSVGLKMILWVVCGLIEMLNALVFIELGTMIPKAGGSYAYIYEAYGQLAGFFFIWIRLLISMPTSFAIYGLTTARYIMTVFFPDCGGPEIIIQLLALFVVITVATLNCMYLKYVARVNSSLTMCKLVPIIFVIVSGIVFLAQGKTQSFQNAFEGTTTDAGDVAVAILNGTYSYGGWDSIVRLGEELKNPKRTLPLALLVAFPLIIVMYVMTNIGYLTVLSPEEMVNSKVVVVDFTYKAFGSVAAGIVPIFVALSAIGALNGSLLGSSRTFYAAGRDGNLPKFVGMLHESFHSPVLSIFLTTALSSIYVFASDTVNTLAAYTTFMSAILYTLAATVYFYLRWKRPDIERPVPIPMFVAILFVILKLALIIVTLITSWQRALIGVGIACTSFPVYFVFIYWKSRPAWLSRGYDKFVVGIQCFLKVCVADKTE